MLALLQLMLALLHALQRRIMRGTTRVQALGRGQAAHRRRSLPMSAATRSSLVRSSARPPTLEHCVDPARVELSLPLHPCRRRGAAAPRAAPVSICCVCRPLLTVCRRPPRGRPARRGPYGLVANTLARGALSESVRREATLTARSGQQGAPARAGGSATCGGQCRAGGHACPETNGIVGGRPRRYLRGFSSVASAR